MEVERNLFFFLKNDKYLWYCLVMTLKLNYLKTIYGIDILKTTISLPNAPSHTTNSKHYLCLQEKTCILS